MTKTPRYSTDQPDSRPDPSSSVRQRYQSGPTHVPAHLRYDWRYAHPSTQSPCSRYSSAAEPITAPLPKIQPKMSRRGAIVVGAVAAAVLGGGIGAAAVGINDRSDHSAGVRTPVAQAPAGSRPASAQPAGTVEQVAAKVIPSV